MLMKVRFSFKTKYFKPEQQVDSWSQLVAGWEQKMLNILSAL